MTIKTKIAGMYLLRLGVFAFFCFGACGWFIYDGTVKYPNQRERALKYREIKGEEPNAGWEEEWEAVAGENSWPTDDPGFPKKEGEIFAQLVLAGVTGTIAIPFTFFFLRNRGRWIQCDENGLETSWGRRCEFSQITALDKKKWKFKGIAKVLYERDNRKRQIVLDDWKYTTDPTVEILRRVESHLEPSQFLNGKPEPPPKKEQSSDEAAEATPGAESDAQATNQDDDARPDDDSAAVDSQTEST